MCDHAHRLHYLFGVSVDEGKKRLLIVDDDPPIRDLLKRVGTRAGFETETASDGEDAFEKLEKHHYDIIIVDLMMPRMSGFQLIEKISTHEPRPTVIVSTALMNGDLARLDDSMIRRVIRKPFDLTAVANALIDTAREIADRRPAGTVPAVVKQIIPGDAASHANAAAEHTRPLPPSTQPPLRIMPPQQPKRPRKLRGHQRLQRQRSIRIIRRRMSRRNPIDRTFTPSTRQIFVRLESAIDAPATFSRFATTYECVLPRSQSKSVTYAAGVI